jgi:hypothetical protein
MTPQDLLEIDRDAMRESRSPRPAYYDPSALPAGAATGPCVQPPSVSTSAAPSAADRALAFVRKVIALSRTGRSMTASDVVLEFLERNFDRGDFEVCDDAISALSDLTVQHRLPSDVLVALLATTAPASQKLAGRRKFYDSTIATLRDKLPTEDVAAIAAAYQ